jgi:nucleoprotein TPR
MAIESFICSRNILLSTFRFCYRWMTAIVTDNMDEENNALVSKIPVGVSGTALAASLLRDGWSVSYLHFTFNP